MVAKDNNKQDNKEMRRNYLVMDASSNVVDLKQGDVIIVEDASTGINGVASVNFVDLKGGFIHIGVGINNTGRVYLKAFVPVSMFVCMANESDKKRLHNAADAMLDDTINDMKESEKEIQEAAKWFENSIIEMFAEAHKSKQNKEVKSDARYAPCLISGSYVRCNDGVVSFTAKIVDISMCNSGKVKAITPSGGYDYEMIPIEWIKRPATKMEESLFKGGKG